MESAEKILTILEKNRGKRISGAKLAKELGISRNAVWKAINTLRNEGHIISAVKNIGYCLEENSSAISVQGIAQKLDTDIYDIRLYKSVDSTNTLLKQMADDGAEEGTVVIAETQTSGRGRMNREFYSPSATGIYMSILVRPKILAKEALLLTTCTAVITAQAIESVTGQKADIKWVNDIQINGKKVCGILTDASVNIEDGGLNYAVVGIGINIFPPKNNFPKALKNVAGTLFTAEIDKNACRIRIIADILNRFAKSLTSLSDKYYFDEYVKRSFLIGKTVTYSYKGKPCEGLVCGINRDYSLSLKSPDGSVTSLSSGEVSVRLKQ